MDLTLLRVLSLDRYRGDPVAITGHGHRSRPVEDLQATGLDLGQHHAHQGEGTDGGLETEAAHPAIPGVEEGGGLRRLAQPVQRTVLPSDRFPQLVVTGRAAEGLDMVLLVHGRHALRGRLATEPGCLLRQAYPDAGPTSTQSGSNTTEPSPDDGNITLDHHAAGPTPLSEQKNGAPVSI